MPLSAPRPCAHPGCPRLVVSGYCLSHRRDHATRDTSFYARRRWHRFRKLFIQAHPLCVFCEREGRTVPAVDVDHIIPLQKGGAGFDPANLQALCKPCHSRKTYDELKIKLGGGGM